MNETQVDHSLCMANGCPCIGTSSLSTRGGDWCCFIHLKADTDDWQAITAELRRLQWLVDATKAARAGAADRLNEARNAIKLAQRSDLLQRNSETTRQWGLRLEGVLADSCAAAIAKQPEVQS